MERFEAIITKMERAGQSASANPTWRLHLLHGYSILTETDAQVGHQLQATNTERLHTLTVNDKGRVVGVK